MDMTCFCSYLHWKVTESCAEISCRRLRVGMESLENWKCLSEIREFV